MIFLLTCYGRPGCHGDCHEPQQVADGLGGLHGPDQLEGDGGHDGDEAAVTQPQEDADHDDALKHTALRDHHGHESQQQERGHLASSSLHVNRPISPCQGGRGT